MDQNKVYEHNYVEVIRSIRAECAILLPRVEALEASAVDYEDQEMEFLDDFIEVGVNPLTAVVKFMNEHYPDDVEKREDLKVTSMAVGEIFKIMNEKRAVHNLMYKG